jgi:hypothetical protein
MTENIGHNNKDYVCVDKTDEPIDSDTSSKNGAMIYGVRTKINNLYCAYNTKHFCVILVWRTSQTATRGPHSIEQSTIFI